MSDKIKWNVTSSDDPETEELSENELPQDPPGYVPSAPEQEQIEEEMEVGQLGPVDLTEDEEEADDAKILSNARLRLEQGSLYEMLMINDIFTNMDADPQAVKNVQREVRKFAKERMEIMLGMKQPAQTQQVVGAQFNHLEVEVLKNLAAKLSGGNTEKVSGPQAPPKSKSLTPISGGSGKTTKDTLRAAVGKSAQNKPATKPEAKEAPQGVDPTLAAKKIEDMTYDEKLEYNRQKSALYRSRVAPSPEAIPMPSVESLNSLYSTKALTMKDITANFKK